MCRPVTCVTVDYPFWRATSGGEGGTSPLPFLKNREKCLIFQKKSPIFRKKCPICVDLWVKFSFNMKF